MKQKKIKAVVKKPFTTFNDLKIGDYFFEKRFPNGYLFLKTEKGCVIVHDPYFGISVGVYFTFNDEAENTPVNKIEVNFIGE